MRGFYNPWLALREMLAVRPRFIPSRPGFYTRTRKNYEILVDNSRYPGAVLREIRAGREINGHSNTRECARRLARGCIQ